MTREEYNKLESNRQFACSDCGEKTTQPYPGRHCPYVEVKPGIGYTRHINKWHHECKKEKS